MYRLVLLGGGRLEGPDLLHAGNATQGRRLALLALLAVEHPRPLGREKLIAYLWPENDTESGRHLLRQYLYLLRRALGEDALFSHGDELRLNPARFDCDLWAFREALDRGDAGAAVAAYGGPFLDGVFLRCADEFERLVDAERTRLALRYREMLEALAVASEAAGNVRAAAGWWRRLVEHDPYSSHLALRLMQALDAMGDRAGALRHAGAHAALLQAEFGAEPEPDLEALAVRLREQPVQRAETAGAIAQIPPPGSRLEAEELPVKAGTSESASSGSETNPILVAPARGERPAGQRPPGTDPSTLPRVWHLGVAGMLVLGLLAMLLPGEQRQQALALFGFNGDQTLLSRGVLAERERILLADFASPTGDSLLARLATVAFRVDVTQSPILTLLEPQQVHEALARMQRSDVGVFDRELAREVAMREGIKAVLAGEIVRSGDRYLLSAQLFTAQSGEVLTAHREIARDSTALLSALDRLSKKIRRGIGESLRSVRSNPPLAQVTTSSLDALRKYSQASEVLAREGPNSQVIRLFEEAIALDTSFASAYRALGAVLRSLGEQPVRQVEMITRAYRYSDRLPDRERYHLLAHYYVSHAWELEKAITALRTLLETHPNDALALSDLGALSMMQADYARAEEWTRRALQVDSSRAMTFDNLVVWQFNQGKVEEAEATFRQLVARFPEDAFLAWRSLHLAAARGDFPAAESHAWEGRAAERDNFSMQVLLARELASLAAVRGRLSEAERYAREALELNERRSLPDEQLLEALHLAHLEITLGRPAVQALERVELTLDAFPLPGMPLHHRPYPDLAALYARAGQPQRARALLAEWEAVAPLELRRVQYLLRTRPILGRPLPWVLGEIALAEGRVQAAADLFRQANQSPCLICTLPHLGRAYEQAAQPDSVIAVYERYLRTPFIHRLVYDQEWRAVVLERLGQLYDARGDHAKAAEHYTNFIELWRDADPELQPRVRAARRRVAALLVGMAEAPLAAGGADAAWAGAHRRREPHYYRIHGPTVLVEYDNTLNNANHSHTVWRDLEDDLRGDLVRRHYALQPHPHGTLFALPRLTYPGLQPGEPSLLSRIGLNASCSCQRAANTRGCAPASPGAAPEPERG